MPDSPVIDRFVTYLRQHNLPVTEQRAGGLEGAVTRGTGAVVAPPLPFGLSAHHMAFPGTLTLRSETFMKAASLMSMSSGSMPMGRMTRELAPMFGLRRLLPIIPLLCISGCTVQTPLATESPPIPVSWFMPEQGQCTTGDCQGGRGTMVWISG